MVVLQGDEMITADDESVRAQSETLAIVLGEKHVGPWYWGDTAIW